MTLCILLLVLMLGVEVFIVMLVVVILKDICSVSWRQFYHSIILPPWDLWDYKTFYARNCCRIVIN
jgi:hypothetical protein